MKTHPLCDLFPEMNADEFDRLVESMKLDGYSGPPGVVFEGMLLDGRHRRRAAKEAGVPFPTEEFKGDAAAAVRLVINRNLNRRNLSASQRAMVAQSLVPYEQEAARNRQKTKSKAPPPPPHLASGTNTGSKGEARVMVAKAAGVSPRYISDAKAIAQKSPETAERVKSGELSIPAARKAMSKAPPPPPGWKGGKDPAPLKDELGRPVTDDGVAEALARIPEFEALINDIHALKRRVLALAGEKVGTHLSAQQLEAAFKNIVHALKFAAPATTCPNMPNCRSRGGDKLCRGLGWVTREMWDRIPAEEKS